jgi:hypothetical protein
MVGEFAFVAYPAEYGNSGVMTFIMKSGWPVAPKRQETASAMAEFDPDGSWSVVQE